MTDLTKLEDILPLYRLCLGNPAEVLAMVKGNPDAITWTALDGSTLLHWMAAGNHPDCPGIIPEFLGLEGSLTLNKDQSGALPIHWAARWGSLENLVCLARFGNHARLPRDTIGRDIMHWFAHARQDSFAGSQKLEFMTSQMAAGLDGREDRHGGTPLHWASAFGGEVGILVEKMPELVHEVDDRGATALHWMAGSGISLDINLPLLLDAGADPDAACHDGTVIDQLIRSDQQETWVRYLTGNRPSSPPF
ncbi:MAG: ankyrin repeat domain-containing protein [Rhodobacteraceae bacterium]|nr:ankyrin repeat domain-containing protein [Paracoccaceae bacterium]